MRPAVSVVIPAYRAGRTLPGCLDAVLAQDVDVAYEVVLVLSADHERELGTLPDSDRLRVIRHVPRLPAAVARNRGVAAAAGDTLAFLDADAIPQRTWLRALLATGGDGVVAGAIENGTPGSPVGTAEYAVAFLDLRPSQRRTWHGATCNLLVPRVLWEQYGPFPEDMLGGEDTYLTAQAWRDGRLRFAADAVVTHFNRTRFREVVAHQHTYGRFTAQLGRRGSPYRYGVLVRHTVLAPIAGLGRTVAVLARAAAALPTWTMARALPTIIACVAAWTAGLAREGARLDRAGSGRARSSRRRGR